MNRKAKLYVIAVLAALALVLLGTWLVRERANGHPPVTVETGEPVDAAAPSAGEDEASAEAMQAG
ncbi:MAG: hypothetical protein R3212_06840, partial [Xanthomonadales bacterium]|nr:hypothetical protein [Xanthomonadales bacterium]